MGAAFKLAECFLHAAARIGISAPRRRRRGACLQQAVRNPAREARPAPLQLEAETIHDAVHVSQHGPRVSAALRLQAKDEKLRARQVARQHGKSGPVGFHDGNHLCTTGRRAGRGGGELLPVSPAEISRPIFRPTASAAMRDYHLVLGDPARGERMGLLTRERLQREIDLLHEVGVLDQPVTVDQAAALEFVPPP